MINNNRGFSLIELLLVVTIIGIIAAIAIPNLQKSRTAGRVGSVIGNLKVMQSEQMNFHNSQRRFGNVVELAKNNSTLGQVSGTTLVKSGFRFQSTPNDPAALTNSYSIQSTQIEDVSGVPLVFSLSSSGQITGYNP